MHTIQISSVIIHLKSTTYILHSFHKHLLDTNYPILVLGILPGLRDTEEKECSSVMWDSALLRT